MYYKISKTTPLGKKLIAFHERVLQCRKEENKWIAKMNKKYSNKLLMHSGYITGNILGIMFPSCPGGWCLAKSGYPGFFRPKKLSKNRKVIEQMKSFTKIKKEELNNIFGLRSKRYGDKYFSSVRIHSNASFYIVAVPVYIDDWNPPTDMQEILTSEYKDLTRQRVLQTQ